MKFCPIKADRELSENAQLTFNLIHPPGQMASPTSFLHRPQTICAVMFRTHLLHYYILSVNFLKETPCPKCIHMQSFFVLLDNCPWYAQGKHPPYDVNTSFICVFRGHLIVNCFLCLCLERSCVILTIISYILSLHPVTPSIHVHYSPTPTPFTSFWSYLKWLVIRDSTYHTEYIIYLLIFFFKVLCSNCLSYSFYLSRHISSISHKVSFWLDAYAV